MYFLAITIDNYYWERKRECNYIQNFTSTLPTQTLAPLTKSNQSRRSINSKTTTLRSWKVIKNWYLRNRRKISIIIYVCTMVKGATKSKNIHITLPVILDFRLNI